MALLRLAHEPDVRGELGAWAFLAAGFAAYVFIFLPLIPADGQGLGHDYSLHLPNLLAGYFFFLMNGPFSVPWFNPAQCAGIPFLADLNVAYYSLPQWLTFFVDPVTAVRGTFVIFAALQTAGGYLLMRRRFATSRAAAVTVAILLLFNNFFAYRMAIGHLTFHPFALAPWIAFFCLARPGETGWMNRPLGVLFAAVLVGILTAYEFQAGMVHTIIPVALAVAVILLLHGHLYGHSWRPWIVLTAGGLIAIGLSAERLGAAIAFLAHFPRDHLRLPGFPDLLTGVRVAFESVFLSPPPTDAAELMVNREAGLSRHEWEFSIGPAAALLIAAGVGVVVAGLVRQGIKRDRLKRGALAAAAIIFLLALPILVNWYTPGWNAILKRTPTFSSSANLVRWFSLYIPVVAVFAGLALDRLSGNAAARMAIAVAVTVATIAINAFTDKEYYRNQKHNGSVIVASWNLVRTKEDVPFVAENAMGDVNRLAFGYSRLRCYQPMFGYFGQFFIVGAIGSGPILWQAAPERINFKNPACYLFPEENQCVPGDEFTTSQMDEAATLASYRTFNFNRPLIQKIAGWVNLATLAAALLVLVGVPVLWLFGRRTKGASPPAV